MSPLATFHPFPRLPWELRNEIWKQSIRPLDRPGAHIFCLDLREPEDVTAKECDIQCPRILSVPLYFEHPRPPLVIGDKFIHISVPAKTLSSGPVGNPSTYMVDGGLWTACKESRAVMEHTFNHQKWDPIRKAYPAYWKLWKDTLLDRMHFTRPPPPPFSPGSDDSFPSPPRPQRSPRERPPTPVDPYGADRSYSSVPATAFFWSSPSLTCSPRSNELDKADHSKGQAAASPRFVTVLPMQDLIIIRPSSWTPHIHEGYWQALEHGFPFGAKKYGFPGFCGWNGFAIEYDPSWGERQTWCATWRNNSTWLDDGSFKLPDGTVGVMDSIYKAVSNFEHIQTIWLIDYRLKAKQNTPAAIGRLDSSQTVFYGGDGCQFVEVYPEFVESGGDYLNEYYTEGIDGENSAMSQGSCHWFIEEFEVRMFGDLYDSDESVDSNYSRYPPHIGLLACLP